MSTLTHSPNSIFTGNGGLLTNNSSVITTSNLGNYYNGITINSFKFDPYNPLKLLSYSVDFQFNGKEFTKKLLTDNIKGIKRNKFIFNCDKVNNRIQPYELIMKLIEKEEKLSVKVKVSDILTICYTNFLFTEICNNISFINGDCDFSELKVKFKYEKILYENHKLSTKQLRNDKMKKIMDNNI